MGGASNDPATDTRTPWSNAGPLAHTADVGGRMEFVCSLLSLTFKTLGLLLISLSLGFLICYRIRDLLCLPIEWL